MNRQNSYEKAYAVAKEQFAEIGVDTDKALKQLEQIPISIHCWQSDDVGGFETRNSVLSGGGIQVTGNYKGRARNISELKQDIEKVISLVPGKQRLNLHAIYGDFNNQPIDRNQIELKHFQSWIDWAKTHQLGIDFNPTCFSHPLANDGYTLSSKEESKRRFWVEHVMQCRKIAAEIGAQLQNPVIHNIWIPDGSKDTAIDRLGYRKRLYKSLDEIFSVNYSPNCLKDSLESKLFGIGSESMVVGSHEFYMGYAIKNNKLICLDNGHFHPTEQISDKISSVLLYVDELLLHVTRGVRWDSDHVVVYNDELQAIAHEIVRADALSKVHVGLDYFDASINRIGAYVVGIRAAQMAFLNALLEPTSTLVAMEESGQYFERLALLEIMKTMPMGAVYNYYCLTNEIPVAHQFINEIQQYEKTVLTNR